MKGYEPYLADLPGANRSGCVVSAADHVVGRSTRVAFLS